MTAEPERQLRVCGAVGATDGGGVAVSSGSTRRMPPFAVGKLRCLDRSLASRASTERVVVTASTIPARSRSPSGRGERGELNSAERPRRADPRHLAAKTRSASSLRPISWGQRAGRGASYGSRRLAPMRSGRGPGSVTAPASSWYVSRSATRRRGSASAEPFRVCANSGFPPGLGRHRRFARRA